MKVKIKSVKSKYIANLYPGILIESNSFLDAWSWPLDKISEIDISLCKTMLTADEEKRAKSYLDKIQENHFIYGRGIIKIKLCSLLNISPEKFRNEELSFFSKWISFSIANTNATTILAVAKKRLRIGVDIESLHNTQSYNRIGKRFFADRSIRHIEANHCYLYEWMLRECLIKILGITVSECFKAKYHYRDDMFFDFTHPVKAFRHHSQLLMVLMKILLPSDEIVYLLTSEGNDKNAGKNSSHTYIRARWHKLRTGRERMVQAK